MKISEYKQLFLSEAQEILISANNVLISFEKDPTNMALLNDLFRQSHTLKSMAQSMEYEDIAKLTHSMEAVLALLRSGGLKAGKDTVDLLFKSLDALSDLLEEVKKGKAKKVKVASLVERFENIASAVPQEERKLLAEKKAEEISPSPSPGEAETARVPLTQLDNLMDIVGELIINRIRLTQIARTIKNKPLEEAVAQMSRLASELQDQMMQVRLLPLEYIFIPYRRLVRDMSADQKKEVDLIIEGGHIGLDRSIQYEINEPLLHLLKNAVTHGIEEPEERERLKKSKRGRIKLLARRERNFVVIELSDDGRGIDTEEVKEIALARGIITREELSDLTPEETVMLITRPGYSGVKNITEAAGRGVGLNAARIKVESFGGILNIDTRPNEGTTFFIKLPLTMAIVQVMTVGIADETYCVPLSYITETIKVSSREIRSMEHHEIISYRDTVLPLIRLKERLGFESSELEVAGKPPIDRYIPVLVVEVGPKKAGLVVDTLLGQQEAVIKPLTGMLKEIKGVSGATILGTGKVAFVLDVPSVV